MDSYLVDYLCIQAQDAMYEHLNALGQQQRIMGQFLGIPIAIVDVSIEIFKRPLLIIEKIVFAAINLIGAAFSRYCSLYAFFRNLDTAVSTTLTFPYICLKSPIALIYQISSNVLQPEIATTINLWKADEPMGVLYQTSSGISLIAF